MPGLILTVLIILQPVCGYGAATDPMPFRQTREGELHFVEDVDINLNNVVFSSYIPKHLGRASIKGVCHFSPVNYSLFSYFHRSFCFIK